MDNLLESFFGPLNKDYCLYFYILSVVGFILLTMMLATTLMVGITKRKGIDFYLQMFSIALGYGVFYFQNRLLYSMCVGNQ
jgi:hypothetical protein